MMYPTMVLIFATLVLIGLLMFLVPVFVKIFAQLNGQLPTLTQWVVAASDQLATTGTSSSPPSSASSGACAGSSGPRPGRQLWDRSS